MSPRRLFPVLLFAACAGASPLAAQADDAFGSSTSVEGRGALIGILYDLKQTQQRAATDVTDRTYPDVIAGFLKSDWDETVLGRYFRVSRPLYATRLYIPTISADQAPKAFGVEQIVKPRLWIVHYKGQVAPPEDGVYRFSGFADDIIAARVNGRPVLIAGRQDCLPPGGLWRATEPDGMNLPGGALRHGDWISLKAGEVIDLDVIIGERPGGVFAAYLYIEKQGAVASPPPIFKLAPGQPARTDSPVGPDTSWSVWTAKQ
ncbi:MAG: hypothetical protein ABII82_17345 [Verrucomicrobiota bacterium]